MARKKSVCVIGAGAGGLCAARHMVSKPELFAFDVYEQSKEIGGTWVYTENIGVDDYGIPVHSSMYENLRTNILQEIMCFPDFPFPDAKDSSYPRHDVVLKYLQDYAAHFDIIDHIHLRTQVKLVKPVQTDLEKWCVTVYNLLTKMEETKEYDAVIVCNGHYSEPAIPGVLNIEEYDGEVLHSHDYRKPDKYKDSTVIVFGAAASGRDIALEIATKAEKVYLAHSLPPLKSSLPENIVQCPSIKSASRNGFVLTDETFVEADTLIYCTGYKYTFPFLSPECGIVVRGRRVRPIYKHIINIKYPTMGLIGIPFIVAPFPFFHYQVIYFLKTLEDPSILPDQEQMYVEEREELMKRLELGFPPRYVHKMSQLQWEYNDELADLASVPRLHPAFKELYIMNGQQAMNFLTTFKSKNYADLFKSRINSGDQKTCM